MIKDLKRTEYKKIEKLAKLINFKFNISSISEIEKIKVYELNGEILGFIQYSINYEILDIINICVDEKFRNKNIGTQLLESIINLGEEKIMLEVKKTNKIAINFYKKNKFNNVRLIKNYYGDEDAYSMERILTWKKTYIY